MARIEIPVEWCEPGQPVRAEAICRLRNNDLDTDSRLTNIETSVQRVSVFNTLMTGALLEKELTELQGVLIFKAPQDFRLVEVEMVLTNAATGGTLEIDILRTPNADLTGFATVFNTKPQVTGNTAGSVNPTVDFTAPGQFISQNDFLRLDITSLKTGVSDFQITVYGEIDL